jgi:hypothetical protein
MTKISSIENDGNSGSIEKPAELVQLPPCIVQLPPRPIRPPPPVILEPIKLRMSDTGDEAHKDDTEKNRNDETMPAAGDACDYKSATIHNNLACLNDSENTTWETEIEACLWYLSCLHVVILYFIVVILIILIVVFFRSFSH